MPMMAQQKHNYTSPLRYPGGKGSLANFMKLIILHNGILDGQYVELYAGGASIAWKLLFEEYVQTVHINDLNMSLIAFWKSVLEETDELCKLIIDTPVTMEVWHRQRAIQVNPGQYSQLEIAFSTFFLNRTNRSGILKGGVIGGKEQSGEWQMDARFNKADLIKRIYRISKYGNRIKIYNLDAVNFIKTILPNLSQKTLVYLDPPYFNKGQQLYENHYSYQNHEEISRLVSTITQPWLVSYDSCPEIETLYCNYRNLHYNISYSAQDRYSGSEVIFFSDQITSPKIDNPISVKISAYTKPLF